MPANFNLTLDTTGPQNVQASIDAGATYTTDRDVSLAITTDSPDAVMAKIWGDVDPAFNADIQPLEANSTWVNLASPHAVRVSTGDSVKTLRCKLQDDVLNVSAEASDTITLDTTAPTINVTSGPTPNKISEQATKDTSSFDWSPSADIVAYKVKVVPASGSLHTEGTQIPLTAGSTNMSGAAVSGGASVTSTIKGTDLKTASAGDDEKEIKIFGQDAAGNWSVA